MAAIGKRNWQLQPDRRNWRLAKLSCGFDCRPTILQAVLPGAKIHREPSVGPQPRWLPLLPWSINRRGDGQRKRYLLPTFLHAYAICDFMVTQSEIESSITYRNDFSFESSVFVPLLNRIMPLNVHFDSGMTTISPRQLKCLHVFMSHSPEMLFEVKEALLGHWMEYDEWQNHLQIHLNNPAEAFEAAEPLCLHIPSDEDAYPDWPLLSFKTKWDPEHGAEVWYYDGHFRFR